MIATRKSQKTYLLLIGDLASLLISIYAAFFIRLHHNPDALSIHKYGIALLLIIYILVFYLFELYELDFRYKGIRFITRLLIINVIIIVTLAVTLYFMPYLKMGRGVLLLVIIISTPLIYLWRMLFTIIFIKTKKQLNIAIIGAGYAARSIYEALLEYQDRFNILGFFDDDPALLNSKLGGHAVIGNTQKLKELVNKQAIDICVIAITHERNHELLNTMFEARTKGIEVYDMPSLYEEIAEKLPILHVANDWMVFTAFKGTRKGIYTQHLKRFTDILLALVGLAVSIPVVILISLAIKLDSKGAIFYRQSRVGLLNRNFNLLKFRSMVFNAEQNGAVWAREHDDRVTRIGKIIRILRFDEIPQMWNVLKGEMSFVGPRPERPEFIDQLSKDIPFYSFRHTVKPGITGWAQIHYKYGASKRDALEKLQYDLYYIKNLSFLLDLHVLLKTVRVVIFGKGAR